MDDYTTQSGLLITDKPISGLCTSRSWPAVVQALIDSGEIHLNKGEVITAVSLKDKFFLQFRIAKLPS